MRDAIGFAEEYLAIHTGGHGVESLSNPWADKRFALEGDEFHFMKSISFIMPTNYHASDLKEFADALSKITTDSLYFHIFESRLRLKKDRNDFSNWLETSLGDKHLAGQISRLDPYSYNMEDLKKEIIKIVSRKTGK